MVYEDYKILGPYNRPDGRKHMVLKKDGKKTTVSYPKFIIEQKMGRYLSYNETIHHVDGNPSNNAIDNLIILTRSEHSKIDAIRQLPQTFKCPYCNKNFTIDGKKLHDAYHNRLKGKAGPFCGRSCAGKYGSDIQNNRSQKLQIKKIIRKYNK